MLKPAIQKVVDGMNLTEGEMENAMDLIMSGQATPAQIALAWLLAQKPFIVPIPGTRKLHRLKENMGAAAVELTAADLREIDHEVSKIEIQGARGSGHERLV